MKNSLFLYLFIISVLMNVFTYKYFQGKEISDEKSSSNWIEKQKDSITSLNNKMEDAMHFTLENNDRAQNYLNVGNVSNFSEKVKQALLAYNDDNEGNKYVDQNKMGEQKFVINRVKILNHRWIIADYSNGQLWGEVLLKYFVNEDDTISFETLNTYLYPLELN